MLLQQHHSVLSELLHHLRRHDAEGIQLTLHQARPHEAAAALRSFDDWHRALFLELTPPATAAAIFRLLPLRHQAQVLQQMGPRRISAMLAELESDERRLALSLLDKQSLNSVTCHFPAPIEPAA